MDGGDLLVRTIAGSVDAWRLYQGLGGGCGSILLEGGGTGRWDIVLFEPVDVLSGDVLSREVITRLEGIWRDLRGADLPDIPFTGGAAGYISYEAAVRHTGWLGPRHSPGYSGVWFGIYDKAVVIDRWRGVTHLVVNTWLNGNEHQDMDALLRRVLRSAGQAFEPSTPRGPRVSFRAEMSRREYERMVAEARRMIRDGEVYQVDLAHRLTLDTGVDPRWLYSRLRRINPSPFMGYAVCGEVTIVCNSPERLVHVERDLCETRPIAGTRPRGSTPDRDAELVEDILTDEKERAEHTMLVDMERNDLGRISAFGSVHVDEFMSVEKYSHVIHLVSNVRGIPDGEIGVSDIVASMMPGGTISGTPKSRAMEIIDALEPVPRGIYTGSLGYISRTLDMNIAIRTAVCLGERTELHVGSGIVYDSRTRNEYMETLHKAEAMFATLASPEGTPRQQENLRTGIWGPPRPAARCRGVRILLVDNHDSFTYNLAHYVASCGARVDVLPREDIPSSMERYTHVIISPGPGRPEKAGECIDLLQGGVDVPVLGVCMGHQVIVLAFGGRIVHAPVPVHGKSSIVRIVNRNAVLRSVPREFPAGRYHSLAADPGSLPGVLSPDAVAEDGTLMAVSHRELPVYGVQFHPESVLTGGAGMRILEDFMRVRPG